MYVYIIPGRWNDIHEALINERKVIQHHAMYDHHLCWGSTHKITKIVIKILTMIVGFQVVFILFSGF